MLDCTGLQEERFAHAFQLVHQAIDNKTFPGAALAVVLRGELLALRGFGHFIYEADSPEVSRETMWDLASLTKPLATTSMAMLLFDRGKLDLDMPVADCLPEFLGDSGQGFWRRSVTIRMLLAHSSGLPGHRKLYLECDGREEMLRAVMQVPLEAAPGTRTEYSDIGFIVLGELLERIAGERLDVFCKREIFSPLQLGLSFIPETTVRQGIPATVDDITYRLRIVQGEVNDENASAMGGIAGHAGLFGDALSVARIAECMLRGGEGLFKPETVHFFTTRQETPLGTSRTLGWDTPSEPSQSGTGFSCRSFGHLGYTGTSLWCDPDRGLSVTLLTNRTWPDGQNQAIKQFRPALHNAIVSAL
jgi:CubicO group peptidase (beta-lactamase class C family)